MPDLSADRFDIVMPNRRLRGAKHATKPASSAEFVGEVWFGKLAKCVI